MLSKRTIIGMIIGGAIIGIGAYSLVSDIGFQTVDVDEVLIVGAPTTFQINADNGAMQTMTVTGDKFEIALQSPGDGLYIPATSYQGEESIEWTHQEDGTTHINIQNTGSTELHVVATFQVTTDPILFTYHIIVITSGMVIIGFSTGFTLRKPKGF